MQNIFIKTKVPPGLFTLFMTEIWERFGFYIAQGLLALYMTQYLSFSDAESYSILGAFTALAYMAPIAGGYIADRLIGFKAAILVGGVLLCIGYATLALSSANTFYFALAIIVTGTGFLKPNISSMLGTLYAPNDPHREAGFTIFYVGIYIGVLLATLSSGFVHIQFGWSSSFALASLGMILALITFITGQRKIIPYQNALHLNNIEAITLIVKIKYTLATITIMLLANWLITTLHDLANPIFLLVSIAVVITICRLTTRYKDKQRNKLILLFILFAFSSIFWGLYFQTMFSLTLFIERIVDRHFFGINIPTIAFLSFIPLTIIFLGPIFAKTWAKLRIQKRDLSLVTKFGLGLLVTGLGFLIITSGTYLPNAQGLVSPCWIFISYILITVGELFISPIGLSMVTELAPAKITGALMGIWFFALGVGGQLAGIIASWSAVSSNLSLTEQTIIYRHGFLIYAGIGLTSGLLLLLANRVTQILLKK